MRALYASASDSAPGVQSQAAHVRAAILSCSLLAACGSTHQVRDAPPDPRADQALFRVTTLIQDRWQELVLRGRTEYQVTVHDGRLAVRARGRNSASGLVREVEVDVTRCSRLVWSWRVDELQAAADLHVKDSEDVAASIFLLFGDPGFFALPDPVPTLRYVWTSAGHPVESVVDSPYLPGTVRSLVVRSGEQHLGKWVVESRNLLDDFRKAFGRAPDDGLYAVALFTDNDQTAQPVTAFYEWIELRCAQ